MNDLFGGMEAGGTKFVCAVGSGPDDIRAQVTIPTTSPDETISRSVDFFREAQRQHGTMAAIGIASFGPIDLHAKSATFGYITSTPKAGWAGTNLVGAVQKELGCPVGFDTDVNGAALAEQRWGSAQSLHTFLYLTIGTGIGGGAMVNGQLLHGLIHPEMGHIRLPHDWRLDPFNGICPYHGDCLEGLASGHAISQRWGQPAATLPPEHTAWDLEAHYLALALVNFVCTLSPQRIVMGGGVMAQRQLLRLVRVKLQACLNEYVQAPAIREEIDQYVVVPGLGDRAGVLGAIALAIQASK